MIEKNPSEIGKYRKRGLVGGLLAAALLGATALAGISGTTVPQLARAETMMNHAPAEGFADLVDKVMPSVISVEVKFSNVASDDDGTPDQARPGIPGFGDLPEDSPFRQFFQQFPDFKNDPRFAPRQRHFGMGEGSGFIISADGYAVTNNHVVKDADEVSVKTSDGREYKATVVGTDGKTDLALLKIKGEGNFNYVKFADKEARVGDWVVAVGNPFGLGGTVTTGIVSARGRDIGSGPYDDFMQIDAPINRGNSGGPAFNLNGEVVGVNTAIYSPSGGSVGIGFAIPASIAHDVVDNLRDNGKVTRGWLGVQIQPVTPEIADSLGLSPNTGALVADVTDSSPAAKAGIKTGDTILKVDGSEVSEPKDLARRIAVIKPGKPAELNIVRNGKPMTLSVEVGTMPADIDVSDTPAPQSEKPASVSALGLSLEKNDKGDVVISSVDPGSAGDDKGLKAGDIILEVNGTHVASLADVNKGLAAANSGGHSSVLMLVKSGERQRFVAMPVEKSKS